MSRVKRHERDGLVATPGWHRVHGQDSIVFIPRDPSPDEAREAARLLIAAADEVEKKLPELVEGKWYLVREGSLVYPLRFVSESRHRCENCEWMRVDFENAVRVGCTVEPLIIDGKHI